MKRIFALALVLLITFGLCACAGNDNTTTTDPKQTVTATQEQKAVISEELQGKWYGPNGTPELDINADGTGTVILDKETYEATFTAENNVFTATSEGYNLSGDYNLEDEKLIVSAPFNEIKYVVIFTRTPVEMPEGSYIYNYNEVTYEINFTEGTIIVCEFPPKDNPTPKKIYFEYVEEHIYIVHHYPPYDGETPDVPLPEKIDTGKTPPEITINGETVITFDTNDDITGTWVTAQEGTVSLFGVTNYTTVPITYTFNADGTGTILAMGIIPGTMTYSVENGVLNLTVSMLGDTESGTGYVKRAGDKLYVYNMDKEVEILTRQ